MRVVFALGASSLLCLSACAALLGVDFDRVAVLDPNADGSGVGVGGDGGDPADALGSLDGPAAETGRDAGSRVVLFGGVSNTGGLLNDTWEWEGPGWTARSVVGPPGRWGHAMATLGTKTILFGGQGQTSLLSDTWAWDGARWQLVDVPGPAPQRSHAMAALGNRIVFFGNGETWEWNGAAWTKRTVTPPQHVGGPSMASFDNKVFLFAGTDGTPATGGLASWDGNAWTNHPAPGPTYEGPAHRLVAFGTKLYLFNGDGATDEQPWAWDGAQWTASAAAGMPRRRFRAAAVRANELFVFGGITGANVAVEDAWRFDGTSWRQWTVSNPAARWGHAMTLSP
jgi:hypothetical protein